MNPDSSLDHTAKDIAAQSTFASSQPSPIQPDECGCPPEATSAIEKDFTFPSGAPTSGDIADFAPDYATMPDIDIPFDFPTDVKDELGGR